MIALLKQKEWSPYLAGALLSLIYIIGIAVLGVIPGASGAFENIGGLIAKYIAPDLANNTYFKFVMPPGISWEVILVAGVFVGSFVSAKLSGDFKIAAVPDAQWRKMFGPQVWKRWLVAFVGGIILEYGAGIAGGCTSGLALGGGLLLAPAAFIFFAGVFMTGIPITLLLYWRKF